MPSVLSVAGEQRQSVASLEGVLTLEERYCCVSFSPYIKTMTCWKTKPQNFEYTHTALRCRATWSLTIFVTHRFNEASDESTSKSKFICQQQIHSRCEKNNTLQNTYRIQEQSCQQMQEQQEREWELQIEYNRRHKQSPSANRLVHVPVWRKVGHSYQDWWCMSIWLLSAHQDSLWGSPWVAHISKGLARCTDRTISHTACQLMLIIEQLCQAIIQQLTIETDLRIHCG